MIWAIVSDVQVGHEAALWPKNYEPEDYKTFHTPNVYQKILLDYWKDFWTYRETKEAEVILNLAESIEGNNRKEYGRNLVTPDLGYQKDGFVELLQPYIQGRKYFGLNGSAYHTSLDYNVEEAISKDKKIKGTFCGDILNAKLKKTGHTVWATHKAGDAMLYKSTMLDRNSLFFSAIKSKLQEDPDIIIYGHHHQHFRVDTATRINLIAPTWKFWHPIKGSAKFPYTQPTIGGLLIKFPNNRGQIEVIRKFYPLEHIYSALREI
jgi:hypothetical protein